LRHGVNSCLTKTYSTLVYGRTRGLHPVYTIKLARRAGYMLAGRGSSMFARSCKQGITLSSVWSRSTSPVHAWVIDSNTRFVNKTKLAR